MIARNLSQSRNTTPNHTIRPTIRHDGQAGTRSASGSSRSRPDYMRMLQCRPFLCSLPSLRSRSSRRFRNSCKLLRIVEDIGDAFLLLRGRFALGLAFLRLRSLDAAFLDPVPQLVDGQPSRGAFRPR